MDNKQIRYGNALSATTSDTNDIENSGGVVLYIFPTGTAQTIRVKSLNNTVVTINIGANLQPFVLEFFITRLYATGTTLPVANMLFLT